MKTFYMRLLHFFFGLILIPGIIRAQDYCETLFTDNQFASIQKVEMLYDRVEDPTGYYDSINLYLDLYYSTENTQEIQPMMILLHGGSFITELGNKAGMEEISRLMVAKGFVVASISYTTWSFLLGGAPTLDQIVDVVTKSMRDLQSAIEFVVEFNGQGQFPEVDMQNLVLGGASAGAVTMLHRIYIDEDNELPDFLAMAFENNGGIFPSHSEDYRIAYGLNLSGGILDTTFIDEDEPPLISVHGDLDSTVFYEFGPASGFIDLYGSKPIDERLRNQSIASYLYTFKGGGHTDIYEDIPLYRDPLLSVMDTALNLIHHDLCLRTNTLADFKIADVRLVNTLVNRDLVIENEEKQGMKYRIVDMWGRTLQIGNLGVGKQRLAFQADLPGYYALQVFSSRDGGMTRYQQMFFFHGK